ncbi:CoA transferase [Roseobacter sp. YSTF-M11]|uniref:CoA transferase n=1 Tax=Roseobacter insulae TaxID=2859783 RepID=A0A9X1FWZ5_9RHOB|nr:CoA transferase [Roseobacter insulae]MBW4709192.1 CoA transferase [Roseobacter insulae]
MPAPLTGIRVIDWTHVLAGPACAYYLGLLGAEVIKLERPGRGDAMRHRGGSDRDRAGNGRSTAFLTQGAGKRSLALDLSTAAGRDVFGRLLKSADVLVENHRPATLERLEATEARTRTLNPRLIHCAMTGYGRNNEMANAPAYDVNIQAISGLMSLTGTGETGPTRTGAPVVDYATALAGALGVLAALLARRTSGKGAFVDVSMLETAFALMGSTVADYRLTGTRPKPRGNAANSRSPSSGTFACKEGHISLGVNEEAQFRALAGALNKEDWLSDPRFAHGTARDRHRAALEAELTAILRSKTAADWEARLMTAGVPCARLRTLPQALELPPAAQRHYAERGAAGFAGLPFLLDGDAGSARNTEPGRVGADTYDILSALGYDDGEIDALIAAGVAECPGSPHK